MEPTNRPGSPSGKCELSAAPDPAGHEGREAQRTRDLGLQAPASSLEAPLSQRLLSTLCHAVEGEEAEAGRPATESSMWVEARV
ncbi:hypothetical protein VULLAG_LOCUS10418 [Vulpes lagopus]